MGNEEDIIEENKYKNEEKNKLEETEKTLEEIVEKMEKWEEEYRKKEIGKIKPIEELSGEMVKKIEEVRNLVLKKLSYVIDDEDIIKRLKEIRIEILDIGSNNMAHFDPKDEVIRINERFLKDEIEKKVNPVYILGPTLAEEFMHAATHMIEKYRGWSKKDLLKNIKDRFEKIYQPNKTLKDIVYKKIGQEFLGHLALLYFIEETKKEVGEEDKEKLDKIIRRLKENYPDEYVSYIIKHLEMDKNFYSRENIKELNKSLEGLKNSLKNLEVEILREFRKVKEKIDYNTLKEWRNEIEKINKEWKEGYQKKEIENKINQIPDKIPVLNETIERLNKEIQKVVEYIDEKSKELEYRVPVNKMGTIAEFNYGIKDFINSTRSNLVIYLSNYVLENENRIKRNFDRIISYFNIISKYLNYKPNDITLEEAIGIIEKISHAVGYSFAYKKYEETAKNEKNYQSELKEIIKDFYQSGYERLTKNFEEYLNNIKRMEKSLQKN